MQFWEQSSGLFNQKFLKKYSICIDLVLNLYFKAGANGCFFLFYNTGSKCSEVEKDKKWNKQ